jgi:hypothetical protein
MSDKAVTKEVCTDRDRSGRLGCGVVILRTSIFTSSLI